jgi:dUTP pyrophosphatase
MTSVRVPIVRLSPGARLPERFSAGASGMDLAAAVAEAVRIEPGAFHLVPCGIAVAIPSGYEGQVRPRSGLASRHGVTVLNTPGTIDSDYRGEVKVLLINLGRTAFAVEPGMRIAQLVVTPVVQVEWTEAPTLPASTRGSGGFGHTGS